MTLLDDYARVSRARPCPICDHGDWCLVSRDDEANPSRVLCARVESRHRFGQAGWLHVLRADRKPWDGVRRHTVRIAEPTRNGRLATLAEQFQARLDTHALAALAEDLRLSADSLRRLRVGRTESAWSFPMVDPHGHVVGIALRGFNGGKYAIAGGHLGLFVPTGMGAGQQLLVCEGQTDTAACVDLGFQAIGRPGCRSTLHQCVELVKRLAPSRVVVVGDGDEMGRNGAAALAGALAVRCRDVRVVQPPDGVKDVREWKRRGATRADLQAAIDSSVPMTLNVRVIEGRILA